MVMQFGFELEGFMLSCPATADTLPDITIHDIDLPTDGFPGLVELRTYSYSPLEEAYFELLRRYASDVRFMNRVRFDVPFHTFSREEKGRLRTRQETKSRVDIQNVYNKPPGYLGNKNIASFQISFSNLLRDSFTNSQGDHHSAKFGIFDYVKIIKKLDKEFEKEIKDSKRQPGEYAIKGDRVEYRSLPNCVAEFDLRKVRVLLDRIQKCFQD